MMLILQELQEVPWEHLPDSLSPRFTFWGGLMSDAAQQDGFWILGPIKFYLCKFVIYAAFPIPVQGMRKGENNSFLSQGQRSFSKRGR